MEGLAAIQAEPPRPSAAPGPHVAAWREALTLTPDQSAIWSNLGNALAAQGQRVIGDDPVWPVLDTGPKIQTKELRLLEEAVLCHRRALALEPERAVLRTNLAVALNILGVACRGRGLTRKSVLCHREGVALHPEHAWAWANLGNALKDLKYLDSAADCHRRALALEPASTAFLCNLGITLTAAQRTREAIACFDQVLAQRPDDHNTRWDRGLCHLQLGNYAQGWADYEARFDAGKLPARNPPGARWSGAPYPGQRLLLLSEQGFGDGIWTARYLPQVKALGGELILEARQELIPLLETMGAADRIVPKGAALPEVDLHAHICSLPGIFDPSGAAICGAPYLSAPVGHGQAAVAAIRAAGDGLRVGIVWSGSQSFRINHERRAPLAAFISAFALPGVRLFSLQKGPPETELKQMAAAPVTDLAPLLKDFADTAAAVAALDLVIMTDSAVAHLAGALGTKVWVLANFGAYWLWGEDRGDCPWYGSMRLFRARVWGDWDGVFDQASAALGREVEGASELYHSTQSMVSAK